MSHLSSSEKPSPTRPQRATAGQLPSRFKPEPSPEPPTPREKKPTKVPLPARIKPEPSSELLTPPKELTQSFEMASGSQTPAQLPRTAQSELLPAHHPPIGVTQGSPSPPSRFIAEAPTALLTPEDTLNASNSSDDNNVPNEPAALPTPDNTLNASNSSGNNSAPPQPKIWSCLGKRIYVYPKDHPYDEGLPSHWGRKELAKWNAIKQVKIQEGEAEWDKLIKEGVWNRKKKGVFVYWEYVKDGRCRRWVLSKEDPPD